MNEVGQKEDNVLDYTQRKREEVINKLTQNGMSGDVKELGIILAALDGMDRAALTKKKIQADSEIGSKSAIAGAAITELLTNMRYQMKPEPAQSVAPDQITAPGHIPTPEVIPGELDGSDPTVNYDSIINTED